MPTLSFARLRNVTWNVAFVPGSASFTGSSTRTSMPTSERVRTVAETWLVTAALDCEVARIWTTLCECWSVGAWKWSGSGGDSPVPSGPSISGVDVSSKVADQSGESDEAVTVKWSGT